MFIFSKDAQFFFIPEVTQNVKTQNMSIPKEGPIFFINSNPKKIGSVSHARFRLYMVATTIEEAKKLGMTGADISFDSERGFCWFKSRSNSNKKRSANTFKAKVNGGYWTR